MSEMLQQLEQPLRVIEIPKDWAAKVAALGTAALLVAGCSSSGASSTAEHSPNNQTKTITLENSCGNIDFSQNSADKNYGSQTSVTPNLYTVKNGQRELLPSDKVSNILKTAVSHDYRTLAIFKAVVLDPREAVTPTKLSAANVFSDAKNLIAKYEKDPESVKPDVAAACDAFAPSLITQNKDFRVARSLASEFAMNREGGRVVGISMEPAAAPGVLSGFKISPNFDSGMSSDRVASLQEWADSVLITEDGKLVLKLVTGPLTFDFSNRTKNTPVKVKIDKNQQITITQNPSNNNNGSNSNSSTSNSTNGTTRSTTTARSSNQASKTRSYVGKSSGTSTSAEAPSAGRSTSTGGSGSSTGTTAGTGTGTGTGGSGSGTGGSGGGGGGGGGETPTSPSTSPTSPNTSPTSPSYSPTSPTSTETTTTNTVTIYPTPTTTTTTSSPTNTAPKPTDPSCDPNIMKCN